MNWEPNEVSPPLAPTWADPCPAAPPVPFAPTVTVTLPLTLTGRFCTNSPAPPPPPPVAAAMVVEPPPPPPIIVTHADVTPDGCVHVPELVNSCDCNFPDTGNVIATAL